MANTDNLYSHFLLEPLSKTIKKQSKVESVEEKKS